MTNQNKISVILDKKIENTANVTHLLNAKASKSWL